MRRWPHTFGLALSAGVLVITYLAARHLGLSMKDPEGFLGPAYVRLPLIALMFFAAGIIPQAIARFGFRHMVRGVQEIVRTEWNLQRVIHIGAGLLTFFVTYISYRNMKSFLPLLRTSEDGSQLLYDSALLKLDHWLAFGHNPAHLLHSLLGTSLSAQFLASVYVLYLMLVPVSLGAFLVLNRNLSVGAWYATALGLNWVLGAVSYYLVPTLGPAFAQPQSYWVLDGSGASALQQSLMKNGWFFREDPTADTVYGIAGFASLHVSVVFTACLFFSRIGLSRPVRVVTWIYFVLTVLATIYFGWHYLADDVAGALIGWLAVTIGAWVTGNRKTRKVAPPVTTEPVAAESADH